jgi:hypothetical protein
MQKRINACPALALIFTDPKASGCGPKGNAIAVQVQRECMAVDDVIGM